MLIPKRQRSIRPTYVTRENVEKRKVWLENQLAVVNQQLQDVEKT